jgi:methyl-accepting chemotaxis protein
MYCTINGRQTELSIRGVYRSLKKIYQINQGVKETRKSLREPEMIKNMDNMRLAAETMQNTSKRLESSIQEIKRTGVIEEASEVLRVARENKSSMGEITSAVKEMQVSITALRNELRHIFW